MEDTVFSPKEWQTAEIPSSLNLIVLIKSRIAKWPDRTKGEQSYRQFYRQLASPAMTISDLQRREAPLSTCNHF